MNLIYGIRGRKSVSNFLNFVRKKEANWSANDFSDSCDGGVASETLFYAAHAIVF